MELTPSESPMEKPTATKEGNKDNKNNVTFRERLVQ